MSENSTARDETWYWAKRNRLHDEYGFAIYYEELWGDDAALRDAAYRWERDHLANREARILTELEEVQERLQLVRDQLKLNETRFEGGGQE